MTFELSSPEISTWAYCYREYLYMYKKTWIWGGGGRGMSEDMYMSSFNDLVWLLTFLIDVYLQRGPSQVACFVQVPHRHMEPKIGMLWFTYTIKCNAWMQLVKSAVHVDFLWHKLNVWKETIFFLHCFLYYCRKRRLNIFLRQTVAFQNEHYQYRNSRLSYHILMA